MTSALKGHELTPRERETLQAIWDTGSIAAAAERMSLSYFTVKGHAQNARSKLGARSTLEAVTKFVKSVQ